MALWTHEAEKYPYVFLAYNNRALADEAQGNLSGAIVDYTKAIALDP
ncbi:MAG: tetratricopeptide repeat protein, partial [Anaerolineae bacterium]|nr:tetratricopeptide repeat protein [Anaerolineae bacterium]